MRTMRKINKANQILRPVIRAVRHLHATDSPYGHRKHLQAAASVDCYRNHLRNPVPVGATVQDTEKGA